MRELTLQERVDIVRYRLENAHSTLDEVATHIDNGFYNTAISRMYYACYYAVSALLIANRITTKSHDGVKQMFSLHFIKAGKVDTKYGRFYSTLFQKRITGDYEDLFNHDLSMCQTLYPQAVDFVSVIDDIVTNWLNKQPVTPTIQ